MISTVHIVIRELGAGRTEIEGGRAYESRDDALAVAGSSTLLRTIALDVVPASTRLVVSRPSRRGIEGAEQLQAG